MLKPVLRTPDQPAQAAFLKRRKQLKAILLWVDDLNRGECPQPLTHYARQVGLRSARGIPRLMEEESVRKRVEASIDTSSLQGVKLSTQKLLERLQDPEMSDLMSVKDLIATGQHLAKLRSGAYEKQESAGTGVAIQINLPSVAGYDPKTVIESRTVAKEEFGDLV